VKVESTQWDSLVHFLLQMAFHWPRCVSYSPCGFTARLPKEVV
jgi:hypothetical protein